MDGTVVQKLEPNLGVLLFVIRGDFEKLGNLDKAVLFRLGSIVSVLVASLRFARKSGLQVFFSFRTL